VIGFFRSRIVLPRWVTEDAPAEVRALLLEHEQEHLRAGDPRLLALSLAVVAAMPWNPAAWWQLRRLRLAVEVDCDARVLARRADVRAYGTLLLEVGRRGTGGRLLAAAFSEPASFLERRIRIMTSPRSRRPWLRAAGFGAAALAMVVAACEAPGPVQPSPASTSIETVSGERDAMPNGSGISRSALVSAVRAHYPEVFSAAATDTSTLMFVIAPGGEIERHERIQMKRIGARPGAVSWGEAQQRWRQTSGLTDAEVSSSMVDVVGFAPGQMGPGRVDVLWVRKLSPEQMRTTAATTRERVPAGQETRFRESPDSKAEITAEQAREYVARYLPEVARNGTTAEFVWIIADAGGQVLEYGDSDNAEALNRDTESIANVQVFKTESLVFNGHPVSLVYVRRKA
jgi:hypothetical protein